MPLTAKGEKIMSAMTRQYGPKKGKQVFYASANKGTIKGVEKMRHGKKHASPADPSIKKAMMGGHSQSVTANYAGSTPQGDKFMAGGGFQIEKEAGMGYTYSMPKPSSTPMTRPRAPRPSWRSRGDYDRRSRNEG